MLLTYPFSLLSVFFCFLPLKEDLYDTAFKPNKILQLKKLRVS